MLANRINAGRAAAGFSKPSTFNAKLPGIALLAGVLVGCLAAAVLMVRIGNITLIHNIFPLYLDMKTPTALGFLFGGISLSCLALSRWLPLSQLCAVLMVAVSFSNYFWAQSFDFDTFHFHPPTNLTRSQMSPITAFNLALLGSALSLASCVRMIRIFQILTLLAALIAWLGLSRFFLGGEPLWLYGKMTVPTATCFLILTAGIFVTRTEGGLMKLLTGASVGGALSRQLLLLAAIISFAVNGIHYNILKTEFPNTEANVVMSALMDILLFGALIWLAVRLLRLGDLKRQHLEQSGLQFAALVESSDDAIISKSLDGVITSWNPAAEKIFGYTEAEALGKPMLMLFPPDRVDEEREVLEQIAQGKTVKHFEAVRITKQGQIITVSVTISPIKDGHNKIIGASKIVRDVSQRKQIERELELTNEKFRQLAENIKELVWLSDPGVKEILYISPGYEKIWGESSETLYTKPERWQEMIHVDDRERVVKAVQNIKSPGDYDEEYRIIRPDQQMRWIHARGFPIRNAAGEIYRIAGTAEDITARKKVEEQLRQSQKMECIGQLAGGVAHDFNNILAVIQLQVELLKTSPSLSNKQIKFAEEIGVTVSRAAALTRQLLLFSRQEVFQPRDLNLNQALTSVSTMLRRTLGEDIEMQFNLAPEPMFTHADTSMIDQVLLNLVVNARDAMPAGGRIIIETSAVELDEFAANPLPNARTGSFVRLSVRDNGTGIPPQILPKIFEPFFTSKAVGKGTGLGLATIFGIMQQHQGWINVSSEVGHGTVFHIYFPQRHNPVEAKSISTEAITMRSGSETILLVEDEPTLRASVQTILSQLGHRVLEAHSGVKALELWEQYRNEIHLLLTDLVMPDGVTGKDLAQRLLQTHPQLKVIYMSGYSTEVVGKDFPLQEGINFLTKPFKALKLNQAIRNSLDSV